MYLLGIYLVLHRYSIGYLARSGQHSLSILSLLASLTIRLFECSLISFQGFVDAISIHYHYELSSSISTIRSSRRHLFAASSLSRQCPVHPYLSLVNIFEVLLQSNLSSSVRFSSTSLNRPSRSLLFSIYDAPLVVSNNPVCGLSSVLVLSRRSLIMWLSTPRLPCRYSSYVLSYQRNEYRVCRSLIILLTPDLSSLKVST